MNSFKGQRLRALRLVRGDERSVLAEKVGRSPRFIKSLENGESEPSLATLVALADALDVPMTFFFASDEEKASA